jgi:hypothetical protein
LTAEDGIGYGVTNIQLRQLILFFGWEPLLVAPGFFLFLSHALAPLERCAVAQEGTRCPTMVWGSTAELLSWSEWLERLLVIV